MSERVRVEIDGGIAWVQLDDGKVNAMSTEMLREIQRALDAAERAEAVTVLRGRDGIFSAGFDLGTFRRGAEATLAMLRAGADTILRILSHPFPVLTVCTGHAYPMGAFLMLAADVRLGASGAFRIGMNESAINLTVPRFALALAGARLTPPGFARIASGALFEPEEAQRLGYLDRVVPPAALDETARAEAARLRTLHMPSFAATKARANEPVLEAVRAAVEAELGAQAAGAA